MSRRKPLARQNEVNMKRMKITWVGCAATALLYAALLLPACSHDDDSLPTGPTGLSAVSSGSELGPATHSLAQEDSDSGDSESADDESVDDESVDDESVDDESVDDESVDDESVDDESVDDESVDDESVDDESVDDLGADDDGLSVRGLLFDFQGCPGSLTIDATLVATTDGTRFDCEPGCDGLEEVLDATAFCTFLAPGLPMRASGSDNGGVIEASRVRIDDEIKATGVISAGSAGLTPGTLFTLTVDGLILTFEVGPGAEIDVFDAGATVRVEGMVPPLSLTELPTFIATEIEN